MFKSLLSILISLISSMVFASHDTKSCKPQVIIPIENWEIVAFNTADIPTSQAFQGENLIYSVKAHPHNKVNQVTIDSNNGRIKIKADGRDNFDVLVNVTNKCGKASTTFNVQIDEED
ncbi:hypothetical protein [Legionella cincinnatiensis]|uniref:Cadherin domain-containing protein n=1 Tax=Legionella cincinnatiensis TaxID=28085 RepID=A0A378IIQ7_9GAMM|nr:hypothetical protein [Legionella cincinnatiensis]KTC93931.1 hypothetical protein Lcin_0019 [Legionella cincinnatiensis]STX35137.1 Uncharacterised protein [Legionella cincinnatiensis]